MAVTGTAITVMAATMKAALAKACETPASIRSPAAKWEKAIAAVIVKSAGVIKQ
jgi:hypothetical protein